MSSYGKRLQSQKTPQCIAGCAPALLLLVLFASVAYGQTAPAPQAPAPQTKPAPATDAPTASTNVDEVSLDLVVHDKKHKLILDLKPEDVAVTDNDAPVKLNSFRLVKGDTTRGHMITLVFDPFKGASAVDARNAANKILKIFPSNGYSFAVLDIAGRLRLIQGFTQDRKAVEQAIGTVTESGAIAMESSYTLSVSIVNDKADDGRTKAASQAEKNLIAVARTGADLSGRRVELAERARAQTLLAALEDSQKIVQDQHTRRSLAGLLALVKSQQRIGERKALIYFTFNRQMDSAAKEMLTTIAGAASRAGVSIYIVDMDALNNNGQYQADNAMLNGKAPYNPTPVVVNAHGDTAIPLQQQGGGPIVGAPSAFGPQWGQQQDIAVMTDFMRAKTDPNPFGDTTSPMAGLAKDTGGSYIDAQNSIKKSLQEMLADLTTYYEATYVPTIKEYDGKFRTIGVKPLRTGLNIQTKSGYFALPPGGTGGIRSFEVPLLKLLKEPRLPTDIKFHAAVLQFGELPDGNTSTMAVEVPISGLETKTDTHTNLFSAHISIVAQIKDKNGTVVEHFGEDIARRDALETIEKDKSATITLQRHFMTIPGQYTLEVAVVDRANDKVGAQRIEFEVPPVVTGPSLSDLVLVRKMDAFQEDDDPQEPMRYEKGKITPNLSGDVPQNAKSVSLFFILHPDPKSKEPATLEMVASRNGRPGKRLPLPLRLDSADATAPYLASFKSGLAPGDYEVKAMMTQGGKTTIQSLSFTVEGEQVASTSGATANANPQGHGDATAADGMTAGEGNDAPASGLLAITAITDPVPPPSREEIQQLIADTRDRALHYIDSLPNFMCVEVTNRSVDSAGSGRWKLRDSVSELLRYHEKSETRTMLEVNGKANTTDREAMKGTFSSGELGGVLKAVFLDSAKADFTWKETDALGSGTVQVFSYRVAQANSVFSVVGMNDKQVMVAFHGLVFIDTATRNVRRISLEADNLPRDFPTHSTSIGVDYDYVAINGHDYLMPISAEMRLRQGRHEAVMNTIEFRNYRRFGSNMRILGGFTPVEKQ